MALTPMTVWWNLMPANAVPTSWPMAYAFMSSGVPRAVAWPAAEANAAMIDAAEAAAETVNTAFASYRSESGYTMAQMSYPAPPAGGPAVRRALQRSARLPLGSRQSVTAG